MHLTRWVGGLKCVCTGRHPARRVDGGVPERANLGHVHTTIEAPGQPSGRVADLVHKVVPDLVPAEQRLRIRRPRPTEAVPTVQDH